MNITLEIQADDLDEDNRMATPIQELDKVLLREGEDRASEAFSEFDQWSRKEGVPMSDYTADFKQK